MTSDGEKFRVAILQDGGSGKYKKFVKGTNNADYSKLQQNLDRRLMERQRRGKAERKCIRQSAAAALYRCDACPADRRSASVRIEHDIPDRRGCDAEQEISASKGESRLLSAGRVCKGREAAELKITRRFWFDRVGGIRLARQQIFDKKGEIESDIVYGRRKPDRYGRVQSLAAADTRDPAAGKIFDAAYVSDAGGGHDREYSIPTTAFVLQNTWEPGRSGSGQEAAGINCQQTAGSRCQQPEFRDQVSVAIS